MLTSLFQCFSNRLRGKRPGLKNTTEGCNYSSYFISRAGHTSRRKKRNGNSLSCMSLLPPPFSYPPGLFFQNSTHTRMPLFYCADPSDPSFPRILFLRSRYEKRQRKHTPDVWTYHFVGYSTLFPFYCYPEKIRLRIR